MHFKIYTILHPLFPQPRGGPILPSPRWVAPPNGRWLLSLFSGNGMDRGSAAELAVRVPTRSSRTGWPRGSEKEWAESPILGRAAVPRLQGDRLECWSATGVQDDNSSESRDNAPRGGKIRNPENTDGDGGMRSCTSRLTEVMFLTRQLESWISSGARGLGRLRGKMTDVVAGRRLSSARARYRDMCVVPSSHVSAHRDDLPWRIR
ncbi:hypothetical protein VTI74DRAFT_10529 [Chaetomium olivicolor]